MEKGVPIRSISRSLDVLQFINRHGSVTMTEVARGCKLAYPTVVRIVQTLMHSGMVECEPSRKHYRPTALVETLALGYRGPGHLVDATRPHIVALTQRLGWPVALSTRIGASMVLRDSTYAMSALSFNNYYPGYTFPILECASGHSFIAFSDDTTRDCLLLGLEEMGARSVALTMFKTGQLVRRIRADGYAAHDRTMHTANPGKTSSIGVPVFEGGVVVATLTLSYFSTAMTMEEALKRYADALKDTAARAGESLSNGPAETRTGASRAVHQAQGEHAIPLHG